MTDTVKATVVEDTTIATPESANVEGTIETSPEGALSVHEMDKQQLVDALRTIVDNNNVNSHKEVVAIKQALFALRQRELSDELNAYVEAGNDPTTFVSTPDPLEDEAKDLQAKFREMRNAYLEAEEARKSANLERKQSIIADIKALTEDIDNINLNFPKFQELQQAFKEVGDVPAQSESEIWKSYQGVVEQFYDCLNVNKELRALDFKKNLEAKRVLIENAKALADIEDVIEAGRRLQQLHLDWREIGPVAKELRDEIWEEFREASTVVNKRHQEYFEQRKATEQANEEAKVALCQEIEAIDLTKLDSFNVWEEAQERIKEMQARWKTIGPASRKTNNELYQRFRAACDAFFNAKGEFVRGRRETMNTNLQLKTELCEKAETLASAPHNTGSLDAVIKLQTEWKTIGNVGKKFNDAIWERFSKACNAVFEAQRKVQNERRNEENGNLEKKRSVVARLNEIPIDIERREGLQQVKALQKEWQEIGHVPFKQKDKIYAEYREVCDRLYDAFNAGRTQERRRNFEEQIKNIKGDDNKIGREREKMLRAIDQRRQELKTYENNLGFFNIKSSAGNSMYKEMEKKMNRLKQEIAEIQEKISMLDEA